MWFCIAERMASAPRFCTQLGVWLCQTSVCPCTCWPFCVAKSTIASAPDQLNWFWLGSVASHFMAFSAVIWLNSVPAMFR